MTQRIVAAAAPTEGANRETIRVMRTLALISITLACGTPSAQPTQPMLMAHDEVEPAPSAYRAPADAGVDAQEETLRSVFERPDAAVTVADVLKSEGVQMDAGAPAVDPSLPAGAFYEDGVLVMKAKKRWWCAVNGVAAGLCGDDERGCRTGFKAKCRQVGSWACLKATARTSGETTTICFDTYGKCDSTADTLAMEPEVKEVIACAIFRYDAKVPK